MRNQIIRLAELRTEEGYMAEVRLLPDGWLLIENHCPIHAAAKQCTHFCKAELSCFQAIFDKKANIEKVEHLLDGARRCTFNISPTNSNEMQHG